MSLQVYNTLTKQKELFEPVNPGKVGIYLCGPTVYKPSHIGHAVGPIIFDAIKRYLVHKGYQVTFIVNITDVDDKIINEAAKEGVNVNDLASRLTQSYFDSLKKLGVRSIDAFPRATEYIGKIIELVNGLVQKGAAYVADGDVYFDHTKAADYGKLSGRRTEEALAGTRDLASKSRHPADFALWKASKPAEPSWDSPWGPGRPGWHIECSAMSMSLLGETFDIHGGGMDLIFPHHENEIAQSETATGKPYVKYWLHNGLTRIKTKAAGGELRDEKMSKSLGNIRLIGDLLAQYGGETIRMFVLSTHYRRPLDFSDEQLDNSAKALQTFYRLFERIERITGENMYQPGDTMAKLHEVATREEENAFVKEILGFRTKLYQSMDDDFNTAGAIAALHEQSAAVNRYIDANKLDAVASEVAKKLLAGAGRSLVQNGQILGLFEASPQQEPATGGLEEPLMQLVIELRAQVRQDKNWPLADKIRDGLKAIGIVVEDTAGGTIWRKQ